MSSRTASGAGPRASCCSQQKKGSRTRSGPASTPQVLTPLFSTFTIRCPWTSPGLHSLRSRHAPERGPQITGASHGGTRRARRLRTGEAEGRRGADGEAGANAHGPEREQPAVRRTITRLRVSHYTRFAKMDARSAPLACCSSRLNVQFSVKLVRVTSRVSDWIAAGRVRSALTPHTAQVHLSHVPRPAILAARRSGASGARGEWPRCAHPRVCSGDLTLVARHGSLALLLPKPSESFGTRHCSALRAGPRRPTSWLRTAEVTVRIPHRPLLAVSLSDTDCQLQLLIAAGR